MHAKLETVFRWKERSIITKEIPGEEADTVADGRQEKGDSGCRSRGNAGVGQCHDICFATVPKSKYK